MGRLVKAINQSGYGDQVTFMSTGGGAPEFLEGKDLSASRFWINPNNQPTLSSCLKYLIAGN